MHNLNNVCALGGLRAAAFGTPLARRVFEHPNYKAYVTAWRSLAKVMQEQLECPRTLGRYRHERSNSQIRRGAGRIHGKGHIGVGGIVGRHRLNDARQHKGWHAHMRNRKVFRTWVGKVTFNLPSTLPEFCVWTGWLNPDAGIVAPFSDKQALELFNQ